MTITLIPLARGLVFTAAVVLAGCGGSDSSDSGTNSGANSTSEPSSAQANESPEGRAGLAARDAQAEQLSSLQMTLSSAMLVSADGSTEAFLESSTEVDFATLTEVDQLIADANIDVSSYTALDLTLDLSATTAWIKGQSSEASIEDENGNALTGMQTLRVDFSSTDALTVSEDSHALVVLDMDLNASTTVDMASNTVMLDPRFLVETGATAENRPLVMNGTVSASTQGSLMVALNGNSESQFELDSRATTVFHIDGETTVGTAGEGLVSTIGSGIQIIGEIGAEGEFTAETVFSGEGAMGHNLNGGASVQGVITERTMNELTGEVEVLVSGASVMDGSGTMQYEQSIWVETGGLTRVQTEGDSQSSSDLSVGQEITATGSLVGTTLSAQAGVVTLHPTRVVGVVTTTGASQIEIALTSVEGRAESLFDFSGSGSTVASNFTVDITAVSGANLEVGDAIVLHGISTGATATASADFKASTSAEAESSLMIDFGSSAASASIADNGEAVVINGPLPAKSEIESEVDGSTDLSGEASATIQLATQGRYSLETPDSQATFQSAASLTAELQARIDAGLALTDVRADGQFDADANVMATSQATFVAE